MFDGLPVNYTDHLKLPGKRLVGATALWPHFAPDEVGETSLMFLVHPTLSRQDTVETCNVANQVMRRASRNASHGPVFFR